MCGRLNVNYSHIHNSGGNHRIKYAVGGVWTDVLPTSDFHGLMKNFLFYLVTYSLETTTLFVQDCQAIQCSWMRTRQIRQVKMVLIDVHQVSQHYVLHRNYSSRFNSRNCIMVYQFISGHRIRNSLLFVG
ncbi:hypothetical protein MS3_00008273 [Schistosoma haematobium]|uniref:Uncharacterized protein n=1 Tax=Schistosoma haematobium TaxID=6185 RepID=A0A922IK30_SCHHA|nr:hypothetical protein MS3_00008273 [Schistosoma haematobium]KAH9581009.1 hypothetical protein MS3_00008273 [Schistosoma haematobium]